MNEHETLIKSYYDLESAISYLRFILRDEVQSSLIDKIEAGIRDLEEISSLIASTIDKEDEEIHSALQTLNSYFANLA